MTEDTITKDDEGKRVLNTDGTEIGRIVEVRDGHGYVEPDPSITDTIKAKLGWASRSDESHPLDEGSIKKITDDAVHLRGTL
ncbi:PRC-barrel domain containing protein [Natronorubrum sp. JWXQ-INN-674]|uniref:PRC-barrel domain containing protein n=1 Tax=Natronorubrum halalkaliphilum TaxID=2691917 RepID=A0A6B0VLP1_9EURY|nr:PRC-barrel domain containing protein [Natronorubrum halalkaliphilum]MXV61692.1 PRC-barrel domain containing protein [Natronorubrum halalkaliphilum]